MPTHEAIANTMIPREVEKPIPVRTISTRYSGPNKDQALTNKVSPAAESAPAAESVRLSPQLTALARKEQAHRQRELAVKAREEKLEEALAKAKRFDELQAKLGAKDFSEAESLGLNYEDYVQYKLDKDGTENPADQKFKAIESELSEMKKREEEKSQRQYEETVGEYRKEIAKAVAENPAFSKIKKMNAEPHVLQLILDSFEEDNVELTVLEAAKQVEDYLAEEKKKWDSLSEAEQEITSQPRALPRPSMGKTLTNEMMAGSETRPKKSLQHLSDEERYAEARRRVLERRQRGI